MIKKAKTSNPGEEFKPVSAIFIPILFLFSVVFSVIGACGAFSAAQDVRAWIAVRAWIETPAVLQRAKLEVRDGDDHDQYLATVRYRYKFGGREFFGERVALQTEPDNFGSYQRDRARELKAALKAGGAFRCYVNAQNPGEAVLFRDLRWGQLLVTKMPIVALFGGIGLGAAAGIVWGIRENKRFAQRHQQHPDEPWQWRDDWAVGRIRSLIRGRAWFATIFALYWNTISWPLFCLVISDDAERYVVWIAALFPVLGAGLAWWAGLSWLRRLRWGESVFEMAATPGVLGGPLAGVVRIPRTLERHKGIILHLGCVRTVSVRTGGESDTLKETVWEREVRLRSDVVVNEGNCALVPVQFVIPYELPPSAGDICWTLKLHAPMPGVDCIAEFKVPVFATAGSAERTPMRDAASLPYEPRPAFSEIVKRLGGVLSVESPGVRVVEFPVARDRSSYAPIATIAVAMTGVSGGIWIYGAPLGFSLMSTAFAVLLAAHALATVFECSRIEFGPHGLAFRRRLLGWGRQREFRPEQIAQLLAKRSRITVGSELGFRVMVQTTAGDEHTVVGNIRRRQDADRLAREIARGVGVAFSLGDGLCTRRG